MNVGDKAEDMADCVVHSMSVCALWYRAGQHEQSLSVCVCVCVCVGISMVKVLQY